MDDPDSSSEEVYTWIVLNDFSCDVEAGGEVEQEGHRRERVDTTSAFASDSRSGLFR